MKPKRTPAKEMREWTYGAEHELADWDRRKWKVSYKTGYHELPVGFGIDHKDITIVNSNGIAADTTRTLWQFGGEIKTRPTSTIDEQLQFLEFCRDDVGGTINYRSNLHIHIRVPGLSNDLKALKQLQLYIMNNTGVVFSYVEPLWEVDPRMRSERDKIFPQEEWVKGAKRRLRRCKVSHHTVIPPYRVAEMLKARTVHAFHDLEVPHDKKGRPMPHAQPRAAINIRQLKQTDTIEFRHFPGTLNTEQLADAFIWCREFLYAALYNPEATAYGIWSSAKWNFPKWLPYCHWQEVRYRATVADGWLTDEQISYNIHQILEGTFNDLSHMSWKR